MRVQDKVLEPSVRIYVSDLGLGLGLSGTGSNGNGARHELSVRMLVMNDH